jgi:putative transposase
MGNLAVLVIHLIATLARLLGPGGVRSLVAESLLLKHQLLIVNRSRQRSPNLSAGDRILAGLLALLVRPTRLLRSAIALKPSTLLGLHKVLSKQKYRMLFSTNRRRKPGPKGPSVDLIHAVVEMKQRNPNWGCPRMAQQIALAFHIPIDKDVVRRILAHHYRPGQDSDGPSWLTFLGHMKDSLWSMDLFQCESATLRTHWVLVVMDQYTRRIIGFGVHAGKVDGVALCRMFNCAIRGYRWLPKYLSSDNDPLYRFHQWQANLRILEVTEIKSIPYVPLSHPFVERLIGTVRREYLDHLLSGQLAISKTSCSISGPTSTTIARIPHWKGEPRLRRCHDLSQISVRFDGSPTADPCIRPQWLPDSLQGSGPLRHPVNL